MTSPLLLAPAPAASPYARWRRHFLENRGRPRTLPWHDSGLLSAAERRLVGRAIQQFQLGEWARGRGLLRRASAHPVLAADPWFVPALELFIAEEQGHSAILGRFLDRERIPRLESHWLDAVFRRLRKLAGLEACAMVLVTAEVLAMPFYQALRDATRSRLLRSICVGILCDEAAHLNYQALTLGLARRRLREEARRIRFLCHAALFHGTALLLWQQHRRVFRAAGWSFHRFWNDSRRGFARLQFQIRQVSRDGGDADSFDELRLD
ncbi:MAG TPA: hypothetical protein VEU62_10350 [Bryobacterales bacterium]|nr:hypothetical protein [Bryobacterales bacterium]